MSANDEAPLAGIDVSHFQGDVDWGAVAAAGVRFAFIKATEGLDDVDPCFAQNWQGSRAAGLLRGAYHFLHPNLDARQQAAHFLSVVTLDDDALPPALDVEVTNGVAPATLAACIETWLGTVEAALGCKPVVYTDPSFWRDNVGANLGSLPAVARLLCPGAGAAGELAGLDLLAAFAKRDGERDRRPGRSRLLPAEPRSAAPAAHRLSSTDGCPLRRKAYPCHVRTTKPGRPSCLVRRPGQATSRRWTRASSAGTSCATFCSRPSCSAAWWASSRCAAGCCSAPTASSVWHSAARWRWHSAQKSRRAWCCACIGRASCERRSYPRCSPCSTGWPRAPASRHRPRLYYIPSRMLNAFAVGERDDAVIALTDGMLRTLSLRELAGVLGHELSHIRNNDLWLMGLADLVGRLTRLMTMVGLILLVLAIPLWLGGATGFPWFVIPLLVLAPQLTTLLQLALSRAREYEADLDAAGLTGDPMGLASALAKLERFQRGVWEQILMPGYRLPEPSLLRSHPPTAQRIARLQALQAAAPAAPAFEETMPWPGARTAAAQQPRGRMLGYWY